MSRQGGSRRNGLIAGVCLLGVILVAAGGIAFARWRIAHKAKPVPVAAAPVLAAEITLAGRVQPRTIVNVGAPVAGVFDTWFVDPGQEIYQGQLLGRIRDPQLEQAQTHAQSDLDRAESRVTTVTGQQLAARVESSRAAADQVRARGDVDRLQKNYDRQKGLWELGATPRLAWEKAEKDFNDAKSDVEKQDAAVKAAAGHEASIDRDLEAANRAVVDATAALEKGKSAGAGSEIHSPTDGIVVARKDLQGQPVDPSMQDLLEIATDLTSLEAVVTPDSSTLARIHAGAIASVRVDDLSPDPIPGAVREIRGADVIVGFTSPVPLAKLDLIAQVIIKF